MKNIIISILVGITTGLIYGIFIEPQKETVEVHFYTTKDTGSPSYEWNITMKVYTETPSFNMILSDEYNAVWEIKRENGTYPVYKTKDGRTYPVNIDTVKGKYNGG